MYPAYVPIIDTAPMGSANGPENGRSENRPRAAVSTTMARLTLSEVATPEMMELASMNKSRGTTHRAHSLTRSYSDDYQARHGKTSMVWTCMP